MSWPATWPRSTAIPARTAATSCASRSTSISSAGGEGALFDELHPLFTGTYEPNQLHRFLAELPAPSAAAGTSPARYQLIVTTNYDDVLERAFDDAGEPIDVVYYAAEPDEPGSFVHRQPPTASAVPSPSTNRVPRARPRRADGDPQDPRRRRPRATRRRDSYVITEDHYIDYLTRTAASPSSSPPTSWRGCANSHFLFLGYGMRDWNLRVILHHIWSQQARRFGSWAIERDPDPIDAKFWQRHRVEILDARLEDWVDAMNAQPQ